MNTKLKIWIVVVCLFSSPVAATFAQDVQDEAGYVELQNIVAEIGVEPDKEINIHGPMLRLVTAAARRDDPDLAEFLGSVRGIFVRSFSMETVGMDEISHQVTRLSDDLVADGWEVFLKFQDRDENVWMFVRVVDDEIGGVVLVSIDRMKNKSVFLNIVGEIDPEQLSSIGDKFGIDGL